MSENEEGQHANSDEGAKGGTPEEKAAAEFLESKAGQAEIDRRVTTALKKAAAKAAQERDEAIAKAKGDAKREAEDAKLLEDGKTQELYERERQRAVALEAELAARGHADKVNALLDKKTVTDPELRKVFLRIGGDLEGLDTLIDGHIQLLARLVEQRVNERLKTSDLPPAKGGGNNGNIASRSQLATAEARSKYVAEHGLEAFKALPA